MSKSFWPWKNHYSYSKCFNIVFAVFGILGLAHGFEFIEKQASLVEEMLLKHAGFKIFTYGRSDIFQLEQGSDFFSDSFEKRRYERRNRKRAQRLVDISDDLSVPEKALNEIEQEVLGKWLVGWTRKENKVNVNPRFMTKYGHPKWKANYMEAINSCVLDTVSSFLYLICKKYRVGDTPIEYL